MQCLRCFYWTCDCPFLLILFIPKFTINVTIFDFEIVNFPFVDGDVPRSISYRVYISQLIRFAGAYSHVADSYIPN